MNDRGGSPKDHNTASTAGEQAAHSPTEGQSFFPEYGEVRESRRITEVLRKETVGGMLLVVAAIIAIVWANSPWADSYFELRAFKVGIPELHLELSLGKWASDGLLAIFFFLVGLELKREFVAGDLRNVRTAIIPVAAAVGGVAVPALIFVALAAHNPELLVGWAIPTATDIAFAVAVLAIIGSKLPSALRLFLLTLAVVDDLIAIGIIAIFYTDEINFAMLGLSLLVILVYGIIAQLFPQMFGMRPWAAWLILLPLGVLAWWLMHESGIHATIAGVLLGFTIPVLHKKGTKARENDDTGLAEEFEHRFRPLSAGVAVPIFAFFAAGVSLGGWNGFVTSFIDPLTVAIMVALVAGKPIGIVLTTWVMTKFTKSNLDPALKWIDLFGVGLLAGIGFTVSLLVAELSFEEGTKHLDHAKVAVLSASIIAAILASLVLGARNRRYARIEERDARDDDHDGVPDVHQPGFVRTDPSTPGNGTTAASHTQGASKTMADPPTESSDQP